MFIFKFLTAKVCYLSITSFFANCIPWNIGLKSWEQAFTISMPSFTQFYKPVRLRLLFAAQNLVWLMQRIHKVSGFISFGCYVLLTKCNKVWGVSPISAMNDDARENQGLFPCEWNQALFFSLFLSVALPLMAPSSRSSRKNLPQDRERQYGNNY